MQRQPLPAHCTPRDRAHAENTAQAALHEAAERKLKTRSSSAANLEHTALLPADSKRHKRQHRPVTRSSKKPKQEHFKADSGALNPSETEMEEHSTASTADSDSTFQTPHFSDEGELSDEDEATSQQAQSSEVQVTAHQSQSSRQKEIAPGLFSRVTEMMRLLLAQQDCLKGCASLSMCYVMTHAKSAVRYICCFSFFSFFLASSFLSPSHFLVPHLPVL